MKPDLWWFDGDWEHSAERWEAEKVRHLVLSGNPYAIINGRLQGYGLSLIHISEPTRPY